MKNMTLHYGPRDEAELDTSSTVLRRQRRLSRRERILLAVAAALFAFSLGLEGDVVTWVLRSSTESSVTESRHLENVNRMLERDQARRPAQAGQQR